MREWGWRRRKEGRMGRRQDGKITLEETDSDGLSEVELHKKYHMAYVTMLTNDFTLRITSIKGERALASINPAHV